MFLKPDYDLENIYAIDLEEFKRLRSPLDEEISSLQSALSSAESARPDTDASSALRSAILSALETLESDASISQKYDALNSIIERCTFDRERSLLSITYRISV